MSSRQHEDALVYTKNNHLGFHVHYMGAGSSQGYAPDFLVRRKNGRLLALEIKSAESA